MSLVACRSREKVDPFDDPDPVLETEVLGASPTDGLTDEGDTLSTRSAAPEGGLVGKLPSTFPSDIAVYQPSSVVDFSDEGEVPSFVELLTTHDEVRVRDFYRIRLTSDQWSTVSATGWQKDDRVIKIQIRDDGPGSRSIRIEY